MPEHFDVIVIGSGAGGGTLAHALAPTGKRILILERGDYIRREKFWALATQRGVNPDTAKVAALPAPPVTVPPVPVLPAPPPEAVALAATIDKVFLSRQQRLSDIVPGYWKELLTTERTRRAKYDEEKAQIMKGVLLNASNVIPPKLQSSAKGIEISSRPFMHLTKDTLAFSFVVSEKGEVKNLQIEKPVGLGKDDSTPAGTWRAPAA